MRKKTLIMVLCAVMAVSSMAFGTIAYLTDRASATNRFVIGKIGITVDEIEVDAAGSAVANPEYDPQNPEKAAPYLRTEEGNLYPLTPGAEYVKDPTMTVKAGSEEAYVRMMVKIACAAEIKEIFDELAVWYPEKYADGFVPEKFVTGWNNAVWAFIDMTENTEANAFVLEFRYCQPVEPPDTEDLVLPPLHKTIKLPGELINAHLTKLTNFTIDVNGNAIQTAGFATAAEAWAAFDAQVLAAAP